MGVTVRFDVVGSAVAEIEDFHFHFFLTNDNAENLQVHHCGECVFTHSDNSPVAARLKLWNAFLQSVVVGS